MCTRVTYSLVCMCAWVLKHMQSSKSLKTWRQTHLSTLSDAGNCWEILPCFAREVNQRLTHDYACVHSCGARGTVIKALPSKTFCWQKPSAVVPGCVTTYNIVIVNRFLSPLLFADSVFMDNVVCWSQRERLPRARPGVASGLIRKFLDGAQSKLISSEHHANTGEEIQQEARYTGGLLTSEWKADRWWFDQRHSRSASVFHVHSSCSRETNCIHSY